MEKRWLRGVQYRSTHAVSSCLAFPLSFFSCFTRFLLVSPSSTLRFLSLAHVALVHSRLQTTRSAPRSVNPQFHAAVLSCARTFRGRPQTTRSAPGLRGNCQAPFTRKARFASDFCQGRQKMRKIGFFRFLSGSPKFPETTLQ